MLTVEQARSKLHDRRIAMVAEGTGLSRYTLYKIRDGKTTDPISSTLAKLTDYFKNQEDET